MTKITRHFRHCTKAYDEGGKLFIFKVLCFLWHFCMQ